jgi:hypothetical protein
MSAGRNDIEGSNLVQIRRKPRLILILNDQALQGSGKRESSPVKDKASTSCRSGLCVLSWKPRHPAA